jgi:hypothetical protein
MQAKASQMESWVDVSTPCPPLEHWKMCIPNEFISLPHAQWAKLQVVQWGRPNLVCNIEKTMSNIIQNNEMIEQTKSQASKLGPMQDFQGAQ